MLVTSPTYQARLRRDFDLRRVHPTIESLIWQYHIGKPTQTVLMASMDVNGRLAEERAAFAALDLHDLEQLAAESSGWWIAPSSWQSRQWWDRAVCRTTRCCG